MALEGGESYHQSVLLGILQQILPSSGKHASWMFLLMHNVHVNHPERHLTPNNVGSLLPRVMGCVPVPFIVDLTDRLH